LFLHQAKIDTVEVQDAQIMREVDSRVNYLIANLGSKEKVEEYYHRPLPVIKEWLLETFRDQYSIQEVQRNLTKVNMMYALAARRNIPAVKWLLSHRLEIFLMLARETEKFLDYQDKEYTWPYVMHFGGHVRAAEELTEWKKQQEHDKERQQQDAAEC
jgi:hypothetical protein